VTTLVEAAAVLAAAFILGNWFLKEIRKARRQGEAWYRPYMSVPGVLILLLILILPLVYRLATGR
jgi:hypothetical protein